MKSPVKISDYLKNNNIQKLIYGVLLVLWTLLWFDDFKYMTTENFLRIYIWQTIIPGLILLSQLIFNNKIFWTTLFICCMLYSLRILWNMIYSDILMDLERDYYSGPLWTSEKIQNWIIMLSVLFSVNWIILKIKPSKK